MKDAEKAYMLAKLSAKILVKELGDQLGYRPKMKIEKDNREIKKDDIRKLVEDW